MCIEWDGLSDEQQYEWINFGADGHPSGRCHPDGCALCSPATDETRVTASR